MSVTNANHAPPRMTQSMAKTADGRELIYLDVTSHEGPVYTDLRVRPHCLAAPAPVGAFVDDITTGVTAQRLRAAAGTPVPTAAVAR